MNCIARALIIGSVFIWPLGADADAGREPVLKQVDLPHNYYWRELYLPQLTSGPSGAAFTPGGDELIYSMDGSLWRQRIGSEEATELTHADAGYDIAKDTARKFRLDIKDRLK